MRFGSSKNLEFFHLKGWIPGPKEKEDAFLARIEALNHFFSYPPADIDLFLTDTDWQGARKKTEVLYGFSPDWIVAHYSNSKLAFFQGAATWIISKNELRIPLIQMREKFETGSLFRLYRREEVLAHEAVHAARMQFDEPIFEEFFAYKTSPYFWRRALGPLFQRSWESYLFLSLLLIPLGMEVGQLFYLDLERFYFLSFLPLLFFILLFLRLTFLHFTLLVGLKKLGSFLINSEKKWAAALLLKDQEIFQFAYFSKNRLKLLLQSSKELRWEMLRDCYFKKNKI